MTVANSLESFERENDANQGPSDQNKTKEIYLAMSMMGQTPQTGRKGIEISQLIV